MEHTTPNPLPFDNTLPDPLVIDETMLLNLALDAGEIMLSSGAETHRVEDTMERILSVCPNAMPEAFAAATGLFAGISGQLTGPQTKFKRILSRQTNLEKICLVNAMSRNFVSGHITLEEAFLELEKIHALKPYPYPFILLGYCFVCGMFTPMFHGSLPDAAAAFLVGLPLGIAMQAMSKRKLSYFLTTLIGGMIIGIFSLFFFEIGLGENYSLIIIGSIMPLVPGMAITNAIRDIMEGDFLSGTARIVEAVIIAIAIAGGLGIILTFYASWKGGALL